MIRLTDCVLLSVFWIEFEPSQITVTSRARQRHKSQDCELDAASLETRVEMLARFAALAAWFAPPPSLAKVWAPKT